MASSQGPAAVKASHFIVWERKEDVVTAAKKKKKIVCVSQSVSHIFLVSYVLLIFFPSYYFLSLLSFYVCLTLFSSNCVTTISYKIILTLCSNYKRTF